MRTTRSINQPDAHAAEQINTANANLRTLGQNGVQGVAQSTAIIQAQATLAVASALLAVADAIGKAADRG